MHFQVEDDIAFLIGNKRPKLSEDDDSDEERSTPDLIKEKNVSCDTKEVQKVKEVDRSEQEEGDTRELNRRSPNGFLLPDPLPR